MNYFIKRSFAYVIDCMICYSFVMIIIQWAILSQFRDQLGITDEWFKDSVNMELYVLTSISLPVWIYFTLMDSKISKGTFGKRILKLFVSQQDRNEIISIGRSFLRTILKLAPWELAHLGVIFPTPMYFEEEGGLRILTILGLALFLAYIVSIFLDKEGRSIYDRILGTKVIARDKYAPHLR